MRTTRFCGSLRGVGYFWSNVTVRRRVSLVPGTGDQEGTWQQRYPKPPPRNQKISVDRQTPVKTVNSIGLHLVDLLRC